MSQLVEKICKNCQRPFKTRDSQKIFCDLKCEEYYKDGIKVCCKEESEENFEKTKEIFKSHKTCKNCGDVFYPRKKSIRKTF